MKILIAKSLFFPDQYNLDITISSLIKLDMYFRLNNITYDLLAIGFVGKYEKYFSQIINNNNFNYSQFVPYIGTLTTENIKY